jgi:hypothetical protein
MKKIIILSAFFLLSFSKSFSQSIENVKFNQEGNKVTVTYDLLDKDDSRTFEVTLEISKDGGITFKSMPKTLAGDVGKNVKPGDIKKISWDVLKDVAELQGNSFVFKVIAKANEDEAVKKEESSSSGGISPYIWIGGGALLVGGAAVLLLSKKSESGTPDLPDTGSIPWPPK